MTLGHHASTDAEVPVLFAGGGLVGLSTAMFLAQHGIASLGDRAAARGSQLPRAAFFHMRTLEMFRSAGIEDDVRARSLEEFDPEGAIVLMDKLAGKVLAGLIPEPQRRRRRVQSRAGACSSRSPGSSRSCAAAQKPAGARVIDGREVVGFEQDASGVTRR